MQGLLAGERKCRRRHQCNMPARKPNNRRRRGGARAGADPEAVFRRLKRLFVDDGQNPSRVTRSARIFTTADGGLGYTRGAFADRMEGPINGEFGCHDPVFIAAQLSDGASVGNCRDQIIADNGV